MIQVLQSVNLLFVEILHLVGRYYLIVVKIYYLEPIVDGAYGRFILFAKHEPDEVLIIHFVLGFTLELARDLIKYTVDCFPGERMAFISGKILFVYEEIVIIIELPKSAVEDVEVLVGEILPHDINVVLTANLEECI